MLDKSEEQIVEKKARRKKRSHRITYIVDLK